MSEFTTIHEQGVAVAEPSNKVSMLHVASKPGELSLIGKVLRPMRIVLALTITTVAAVFLWENFSHIHSRQAFINGTLLEIRSPIEGIVHLENVSPGDEVSSGLLLGLIRNRKYYDLQSSCEQYSARIAEDERELDNILQATSQCESKLAKYRELSTVQNALDIEYAKNEVLRFEQEYKDSIEAARFLKEESALTKKLSATGLLPRRTACRDESECLRAEAITQAKLGQFQSAESRLKAAQAGLSVGSNRELSTPANRIEDLERELIQLKLKQIDLRMALNQDRFSFKRALSLRTLDSTVTMKAPDRGVVWSILAKSGELVTPGAAIANMLMPQKRWVEAFVQEKDLHRLHIGGKAKVKLAGTNKRFDATIESIRAGVGRVSAGQPVAVPPPDRARKEIELRLSVDWPHVCVANEFGANQFYGVGRSLEVEFD
ncbi:MAG: hypothetical protein C5B53_05125 [Candidatus Melainabacteria bacterium]|nr:MAG: hypothetical protein C5B53_05125 [Candidatus Melainabacteria bacterium]